VKNEEVSLISRVPHASDTLSGKVSPDTVFDPKDHRAHRNRDNMLDNFEKAETLRFLWAPETGRTIGQAAIAAILANLAFTTVLPTVLTAAEVKEYAAASELPLTDAERSDVDALWSRNFDHQDRYVMPLKSSV
jgi:aryl-alcohol dehydrogenase-like predicted oxidoreductase